MAGGVNSKISAASARAHTRKINQNNSFPPGMVKKIVLVVLIGFLGWAYQAIQPPSPKMLSSSGGNTAPRIKLRDGRHLAYKEHGVPKDIAKYKIIFVHAFDTCRHHALIATCLSPDVVEDLGVYVVSFDRPGYGESDPHPNRTVESLALDIEELADQLDLGSKFYVVGYSMGGQVIWSCLKYIPHRLAGATLLTPVVNYWWPGFPSNLSKQAYKQQLLQDQLSLGVAHYLPWLTYWWNTQKWFPSSSVVTKVIGALSRPDLELLSTIPFDNEHASQVRQQGQHESLHRDMMIGFGSWEFGPMDIKNPFPNNEGSVHLWQGDDDNLVPVSLQRYIAEQLPWIHYHELPNTGHLFPFKQGMVDSIVKKILIGE